MKYQAERKDKQTIIYFILFFIFGGGGGGGEVDGNWGSWGGQAINQLIK